MGMTEQEAIVKIKDQKALCLQTGYIKVQGITEALDMGIKALEKQIAKNPIKDKEFSSLFDCPSCGRRQKIMYEQNYCKVCGQRLDWRNER